jgi:hypothetical protein
LLRLAEVMRMLKTSTMQVMRLSSSIVC